MVNWYRRLMSAIAVIVLLLGASVAAGAVVRAEEAVLVPGATVFKAINPLYPIVATTYPVIGIHFHDDDDAQVIEYSQNALASNRAIRDGVRQTRAALDATDGDVVVIGESMGSMVAARVAAQVAESPDAPDNLRFVLIAPPEAGVAEYFKEGTYIPVLNYRVSRIPQSSYPTTIVIGEYDGWADPPDRPWNIPATLNALAGVVFVHGPPIAAADPATVPPENVTVNGNVTTYLVPTGDLPLTQPLRLVGIPDQQVDEVDRVLRPVIDAAYRRHDEPGDTRPFLYDGEIRRNVQNQRQTRETRPKLGLDRRARPLNVGESPQDLAAPSVAQRLGQRLDQRAQRRTAQAQRVHSTLHSPRSSAKKAVGTRDR